MLESKFVQLHSELLFLIIELLPSSDLSSLRLTCQKLRSLVSPILFKTLQLRVDLESSVANRNLYEFIEKTANSTLESTIASHAPSVHLVSRSPPLAVEESGERGFAVIDLEEKELAPGEVLPYKYLVPFVRRLINVNSVTWTHNSIRLPTPNLFAQSLASALANLPGLKQLTLNISGFEEPMPEISEFKGLHSLEINYDSPLGITQYMRSNVMPVLVASPELVSFSFNAPSEESRWENEPARLDSLLQQFNIWQDGSGSTSPTTYLRHLSLQSIPVQLSTLHLRRVFQNLKHLTLKHGFGYRDKSTMTEMAWEGIWEALTDAGIKEGLWLETLHTEGVQPPNGLDALLKYLLAHPGIKALSILAPPFNENADYYRAYRNEVYIETPTMEQNRQLNLNWATLFWTKVIPRSAHSLEELTVNPWAEGPWSYGPDASDSLKQCIALKKLTISVSAVPLEWAEEKVACLETRGSKFVPPKPASDQNESFENEGSSSQPIQWGLIESTPVLLVSDLGNMIHLEEVKISLSKPYRAVGCFGWLRPRKGPTAVEKAESILERFVPWEGYPHKLVGQNRIVKLTN